MPDTSITLVLLGAGTPVLILVGLMLYIRKKDTDRAMNEILSIASQRVEMENNGQKFEAGIRFGTSLIASKDHDKFIVANGKGAYEFTDIKEINYSTVKYSHHTRYNVEIVLIQGERYHIDCYNEEIYMELIVYLVKRNTLITINTANNN